MLTNRTEPRQVASTHAFDEIPRALLDTRRSQAVAAYLPPWTPAKPTTIHNEPIIVRTI